MKFIVIGLGYFGATLATRLTEQGHEVIGIDNRYERIDELKNQITSVMEMEATNENALKTLPLNDTDAVIVAIGEDIGSSILSLSILKKLGVKNIIGRIISPIHKNILNQIGIENTVHPESQTAVLISLQLQIKNALKITEIDANNVIVEFRVPQKYLTHTLGTANLNSRFKLKVIAVKSQEKKGLLSRDQIKTTLMPDDNYIFRENDIIVLMGALDDMKRFAAD
ncbi:MAG: TrkA family potassium uptake protein [Salinivirgaceae bacterium]|nr:TrkA family potassium uptake protein [Salinivirgaceae bacterium]MBO7433195.1 TrkA family potassium uptake protein [Salinivirgaceae bacterium]MBR5167266.1 TrkA family potassium uptake protein [Salinivirgaceae bacterium]